MHGPLNVKRISRLNHNNVMGGLKYLTICYVTISVMQQMQNSVFSEVQTESLLRACLTET
jgi:hypothetical protein